MRVLVTGRSGPVVPDGAWPGGGDDAPGDAPGPRDVARWWSRAHAARPTGAASDDTTVTHVPLAASGPAFLDALAPVAPELLAGVVQGPGGSEVPVAVRRDARTATVYADASQVPPLDDLVAPTSAGGPPVPRSSAALGSLLALCADAARAADGRPGRVVLATGGARSHDAGEGLLRALAARSEPAVRRGEDEDDARGPASGTRRVAPDVLRAARAALRGASLVAAVATDAPLLGLHGASAALPARGVDGSAAQDLERSSSDVAHEVVTAVEALDREGPGAVVGRDLMAAASPRRLVALPGAGSGGGAAFAVAALGGRLVPALRLVADDLGLDDHLAVADLVVLVVDELGAHELGEGAVHEVARRAAAHALPVVVVARTVVAGRREQAAAGLSGVYAWGTGSAAELVERVARTWSRV